LPHLPRDLLSAPTRMAHKNPQGTVRGSFDELPDMGCVRRDKEVRAEPVFTEGLVLMEGDEGTGDGTTEKDGPVRPLALDPHMLPDGVP